MGLAGHKVALIAAALLSDLRRELYIAESVVSSLKDHIWHKQGALLQHSPAVSAGIALRFSQMYMP